MKNIFIVGANSSIALPCIKIWAKRNYRLYLLGRNGEKLNILKKELERDYNANVEIIVKDLKNQKSCEELKDEYFKKNSLLDVLFICYGVLGNQEKLLSNNDSLSDHLFINSISKIIIINSFIKYFKKQKNGTIAVITSVAGDIGKSSNFVYGSSNAMLTNYLSGLRQDLFDFNIKVVNAKPGLIETPMTSDFKKNLLYSNPNKICTKLVNSIEKNNSDIYLPFFWRYIILVIKLMPKFLFNRLKI